MTRFLLKIAIVVVASVLLQVSLAAAASPRAVVKRVNATFPSGVSNRIEGAYLTVTLHVDRNGDITSADVTHWSSTVAKAAFRMPSAPESHAIRESLDLFRTAALAAARQWRFASSDAESIERVAFAFGRTATGPVLWRLFRPVIPSFLADRIDAWWRPPGEPVRVVDASLRPTATGRLMRPGRSGEFPGGRVELELQTRVDGSVGNARLITSRPPFDQYALDAVLGWKYEPIRVNGVPAEAVITVTVTFP